MDQTTRFVLSAVDSTGPAFTKVRAGLQQLGSKAEATGGLLSSLGLGLAGGLLGGASVAASVAAFRGLANGLDQLNDAADATGSTVERLSALEDLGARTGVGFDTITSGIIKFNKALQDAGKPDSEEAQVFKRLGLDLAELKRLDPSDAFIKTAQAFGTFAANGNRARGEMLLLGRSTKELAPLMKDVGEAGQLNATVTTAQAEAAERFNKHLSSLAKNSQDLGRAILSDLLPAMNKLISQQQLLSQLGIGPIRATIEAFKGNERLDAPQKSLDIYVEKLAQVDEKIKALSLSKGANFVGLNDMAGLRNERAELEKFVRLYTVLRDNVVLENSSSSLAKQIGINAIDGLVGQGAKDLGNVGGGKGKKEKPSKFAEYAKEIQKSVDQLIEGTDTKKLAKMADQLALIDKLAAEGLDSKIVEQARQALLPRARDYVFPETPANLIGPFPGAREFVFPEVPEELLSRLRAVNNVIASTPTAKLDEQRVLMADLAREYEKGRFGLQGSAEAMAAFGEAANTALGNLPEQLAHLADMAGQLGDTIQYALGDNLTSLMQGSFSDIGRSWLSLLQRMAAQALSIDLTNAMFGRNQAGGSSDLFGGLLKLFGAAAGGGTSNLIPGGVGAVPYAAAGGARALALGGAGQGGGGFSQVNNFTVGVGRAELRNALEQTKRSTLASWQEMQRRGRFA